MGRWLVVALLLATGCGREDDAARGLIFRVERAVSPVAIPGGHVEPALAGLLAAFRAAATAYGVEVAEPEVLRLELVGEEAAPLHGEAGSCSRRRIEREVSGTRLDIRVVRLTRALLQRPMALRLAMYHELGHCLLGLTHATARSAESIMAPRFPGNVAYSDAAWTARVAELFEDATPAAEASPLGARSARGHAP